MFFEKKEFVVIDGIRYDISNPTQVEMYRSKEKMVEIYNKLDPDDLERTLTFDSYIAWRKELIALLKEWDKYYMQHCKNGYLEQSVIHA